MILTSSNKNKIQEFRRILGKDNIEITAGRDLPEVDSDIDTVIKYKSFDAGKDIIVEDTILIIDGVEVVDIKWNKEDKLKNAKQASWIVSVAYNDGINIYVSRGIVNGIIVEPLEEGFGFDPYFLPDGSDLTLSKLEKIGEKDKFSARVIALKNFLNKKYINTYPISDIKNWNGKYQNS